VYDLRAIDEGDFYVKFILCNKDDCFKCALTVVYDPAQHDKKEAFFTELVHMARRETLPIVIGVILIFLEGQMRRLKKILISDGLFYLMRQFIV
jgi:hypothetical protein